ncbi:hypothetical protein CTAYLR_001098 [Chrysophaeum taylorii]|uniref:VapC9 PIN-like domain-containing protein n=1 Tax=Chrysophaeum taylorii TaxID=2483200 RepID=A0AAD7UQH3_9STRA|nr:hypothetical protein CTAYLR_001098 [Chrysophaeum taylorii]
MRLLRAKAARKILGFYRVAFGVEAPYTVLLDGPFVQHAVRSKIDVESRFRKLVGKVRLVVPSAVVAELDGLGCADAVAFCRTCRVVEVSEGVATEAIVGLVAEKASVVVATQDAQLRRELRKIPGVILASFAGPVLALEPPSKASRVAAAKAERDRSRPDAAEKDLASRLRRRDAPQPLKKQGSKKRAAAPNPLSCLPSKKQRHDPPPTAGNKTSRNNRRRRRRPTTTQELT